MAVQVSNAGAWNAPLPKGSSLLLDLMWSPKHQTFRGNGISTAFLARGGAVPEVQGGGSLQVISNNNGGTGDGATQRRYKGLIAGTLPKGRYLEFGNNMLQINEELLPAGLELHPHQRAYEWQFIVALTSLPPADQNKALGFEFIRWTGVGANILPLIDRTQTYGKDQGTGFYLGYKPSTGLLEFGHATLGGFNQPWDELVDLPAAAQPADVTQWHDIRFRVIQPTSTEYGKLEIRVNGVLAITRYVRASLGALSLPVWGDENASNVLGYWCRLGNQSSGATQIWLQVGGMRFVYGPDPADF